MQSGCPAVAADGHVAAVSVLHRPEVGDRSHRRQVRNLRRGSRSVSEIRQPRRTQRPTMAGGSTSPIGDVRSARRNSPERRILR